MIEQQTVIWGIHAGRSGDAETLFLKEHFVAVGWDKTGDLSKLGPDRDAFKTRFAQEYPDKNSAAVANNAGQLYRFVHEMKEGDIVLYPCKRDRMVHIGRVAGPYEYNATKADSYPHRRPVEWIRTMPRTKLSQGALYEIGSAISLFQVKNYADEFRATLEDKQQPVSLAQDDTVAVVVEEIEANTRDFILKRLGQELKGHPLAEFVAHLLSAMGYRTRVSPKGPDGGIDIIAHRDELGFEPPIIKVQVKSSEESIGQPDVSALYGNVAATEYGMMVALGGLHPTSAQFREEQEQPAADRW